MNVLAQIDLAIAPVELIAQRYDEYAGILASLAEAAGTVLKEQNWYDLWEGDANKIVEKINALPTRLGSLSPSNEQMKTVSAPGAGCEASKLHFRCRLPALFQHPLVR